MADTIILMQHGYIVQNDGPVAMYSKPATTFAASFIGTPPMNLLSVAMNGGQAVIKGTEASLVPGNVSAECTVGIRPGIFRLRMTAVGSPGAEHGISWL